MPTVRKRWRCTLSPETLKILNDHPWKRQREAVGSILYDNARKSPIDTTDRKQADGRLAAHSAVFSLDDVVNTEELGHRPKRPADYEAQSKALVALARELADSPRTVLQKLVDTALALCGAGSAGISILEHDAETGGTFRWRATAGQFAKYLGGTMPRNFSPCGTVLDRNATQLMSDPARYFPDILKVSPAIHEVLLVPFYRGKTPVGTVWVLSQTPEKRFDSEDARLIGSLCEFASAAVGALSNLATLETTNELLRSEAAERLRAETSRRESEEFHRFAAEAGRTGSWYMSADTWECTLSPIMAELLGFSPDQTKIKADQWRRLIVPEDRAGIEAAIAASTERDLPFDHEFRIRLRDGKERWLYARGGIVRDASGKALRLHGASVDITERKRAEDQERRTMTASIATAEVNAKFRTFFDQGSYFAGIMALDGTIIEANRLCLDACGFTRDEVIGRKFWDCGWWSPSPRLVELVRTGSMEAAAGRFFRCETNYFLADGSDRFVDLILAPVKDEAGRILFIAPTGTDITEKKRLADEHERLLDAERAARAEAERVGRMKDEFLATLSHELRTPLNAILGWSQLLKRGGRSEKDFAQGIDAIERNARSQTQLIEDLLDMSRIISGKVRLNIQRIGLAQVMDEAIEAVAPAAHAKGVRLEKMMDPNAGAIWGDSGRLQQVMWNLLSNAVKFTPKGGDVRVVLEKADSHYELSVIDSGRGIKPEFLPYVFERFRQEDASTTRKYGGLGLGLAIVKHLVELHGGSVRARSCGEGQGATFSITLPLSTEKAKNKEEATEQVADLLPEADERDLLDLRGIKVLVVDDEKDGREVTSRMLAESGATVISAGEAAEAMEIVQRERPQVIVSDIGMPGEDGYQFIRQIRRLVPERGGQTPAIALTAFARREDQQQALDAGFQIHIAKPVGPGELITVCASLVGITKTQATAVKA